MNSSNDTKKGSNSDVVATTGETNDDDGFQSFQPKHNKRRQKNNNNNNDKNNNNNNNFQRQSAAKSNSNFNKNKNNKNNKKPSQSSPFVRSWAKPKIAAAEQQQQQSPVTAMSPNDDDENSNNNNNNSTYEDPLVDVIQSTVEEAMEQQPGHDSTMAALVSTAAVSLVVSAFMDMDQQEQQQQQQQQIEATGSTTASETQQKESTSSFTGVMQQTPLSALLAEYGEEDPDWNKVVIPSQQQDEQEQEIAMVAVITTTSSTSTKSMAATPTSTKQTNNNSSLPSLLGQRGKAPIHVELVSFGYKHGIPTEARSKGWSHANPLPPFDTRRRIVVDGTTSTTNRDDDSDDEFISNEPKEQGERGGAGYLPTVPYYLERHDGFSGAVKHHLLNRAQDSYLYYQYSRSVIAPAIAKALGEAVQTGGHGYALPLRMTIYIGSEQGRHRSVLVTELTAVALRKILRQQPPQPKQQQQQSQQPQATEPQKLFGLDGTTAVGLVSVGTVHRDLLQHNQQQQQQQQRKQKDADDNW